MNKNEIYPEDMVVTVKNLNNNTKEIIYKQKQNQNLQPKEKELFEIQQKLQNSSEHSK